MSHQYNYIVNVYGTYGGQYGMGEPHPWKADFWTNRDHSVAVLHNAVGVNTINPYMCIALPGVDINSITLTSDLSVDTMDIKGSRAPEDHSAETWFGYLPSSGQTRADSGNIFGYSTVIDNVASI